MSPRLKVLLGLVVALAAALGALRLLRPGYRPAGLLVDAAPARVARVELFRAGRPPLVLVKQEQWRVESHGGLPARGVDELLARLLSWRRERLASTEPSAWASQQVDDATARHVRLWGVAGEPIADLRVGGITGIEAEDIRDKGSALDTSRLGLFVRRADEPETWVVTEFVTRELEPDPRTWFMRPFTPPPRESLRRLRFERGLERFSVALAFDRPLVLEREGQPPVPADPQMVGGLLVGLESLETIAAAPAGAAPPTDAMRLSIDTGEAGDAPLLVTGETLELTAWMDRERALLQVKGGPALEVTRLTGERLARLAAADLVRRRVLSFQPSDLNRLELRGPTTRTVTRSGGEWRAAGPLPPGAIDPALERLGKLEVVAWDPSAPLPPPGSPELHWATPRGDLGALRFGAEAGGRRAVAIQGLPPGWVDAAAAAELLRALEALP